MNIFLLENLRKLTYNDIVIKTKMRKKDEINRS
jgi:hypothetical protein